MDTIIELHQSFQEYMRKNSFDMAIYMEFSLPYYLVVNSGFFEFEVDKNFILSETGKERKIAFKLESYAHENQEVSLRESTFEVIPNNLDTQSYRYSVVNSSIQILIQSYSDEKDLLKSKLDDEINDIRIDIMQSCLEFILFKYNEAVDGVHAIAPSVYDCSHLSFYHLYSNGILEGWSISPNIGCSQVSVNNFQEVLNSEIVVWKTFFNESKYACKTYDFKKTIIYAAVSLETFISTIISQNVANVDNYEKDHNGNYLSIFKKIKNVVRDRYLNTTISDDRLYKNVRKIAEPRNDLMHGKVYSLSSLKTKAIESIMALEELYNDWI